MIIDADGCVVGRLASLVSKELLRGNTVYVVNAEKAVISGNPEYTLESWRVKVQRGHPYKGPFYPKQPDRILKRIIRGMLPYKKARGRAALKRLKVYTSIPPGMQEQAIKPIQAMTRSKKVISLGELAVKLGAKKVW